MADVEKKRRFIINVFYLAILAVLAFFAVRYALGVCFPFLFSFVVASILQRPKRFLVKKTFLKNGPASVLCVIILLAIFAAVVVLVGFKLYERLRDFLTDLSAQLKDVDGFVNNIEAGAQRLIQKLPESLHKSLTDSSTELFEKLRTYLGTQEQKAIEEAAAAQSAQVAAETAAGTGGLSKLLGSFQLSWISGPLSSLISTAKQIPVFLITIVITVVACCFMTIDYDRMMYFFRCQFPEHRRSDVDRAKALLKTSLGKMARAYGLIMLITFLEVTLGLYVLKWIGVFHSNYIPIIGVITAIIDIIPVLGTGTILLPWTVYSLLTSDFKMAIGLIVMYVLITVIRQVIEPKFVAGQLGLSPIVTVIALFLGLKAFGVLGMFVTPLVIIMIKLLNDEGIIHIWRSPARERAKEAEKAAANAPTGDAPAEPETPTAALPDDR